MRIWKAAGGSSRSVASACHGSPTRTSPSRKETSSTSPSCAATCPPSGKTSRAWELPNDEENDAHRDRGRRQRRHVRGQGPFLAGTRRRGDRAAPRGDRGAEARATRRALGEG